MESWTKEVHSYKLFELDKAYKNQSRGGFLCDKYSNQPLRQRKTGVRKCSVGKIKRYTFISKSSLNITPIAVDVMPFGLYLANDQLQRTVSVLSPRPLQTIQPLMICSLEPGWLFVHVERGGQSGEDNYYYAYVWRKVPLTVQSPGDMWHFSGAIINI